MDNLTHCLTALALSRAGLGRLSPRSAWILAVGANLPDVDIASIAGGTARYLEIHRGYTHSIALLPVLAIFPALIDRKRFWRGYLLAAIGLASHLLLDWTNAYGIRLMLPWSGEWLHGDWTNAVDPWIWAILLFAAVAPLMGRLVSGEIGAKPGSGQGVAIFALSLFAAYDYGRFLAHGRALATLDARVYDGAAPVRVAAFPTAANPFGWTGWVETSNAAIRFDLNLLGPFDPAGGTRFFKPEASPALEAARRTEEFLALAAYSLYPLYSAAPAGNEKGEPDGSVKVELRDMRYPPFAASAVVAPGNRVISSSLRW